MLCLALALALCITAAAAARTPDAEMPSFLFVLGDDIGWADFHYVRPAHPAPCAPRRRRPLA